MSDERKKTLKSFRNLENLETFRTNLSGPHTSTSSTQLSSMETEELCPFN